MEEEVSAPYIPISEVDRLITDVMVIERQFRDANGDPRDVSGWTIGIEVTHPLAESLLFILNNNSPYINRPQNHIMRLKVPTPVEVGMNLGLFTGEIRPYQMRWFRLTADGQETFWYVDAYIYKRLPPSKNTPGPTTAEVFVSQLTDEGGEIVDPDFQLALEARIDDVESGLVDLQGAIAGAAPAPVGSLAAAITAAGSSSTPKLFYNTVNKKAYIHIPGAAALGEIQIIPATE